MINEKLMKALEGLNIPIYWMENENFENESEYIIFQTNNQQDINFSDDIAHEENYSIGIIYWFNTSEDLSKVDDIRNTLKANGFIKRNERDMKQGDYYGRSFSYSYTQKI